MTAVSPRRAGLLPLLLLAVAGTGCGKQVRTQPDVAGPMMGVFRVAVEEAGEKTRRFKLLLFAGAPDRLHGEIVSPVGTTVAIFDGGAGRLAVTFPRDRTAFVGVAREDALERIFGVPISLEGLVTGLLGGDEQPAESRIDRIGPIDELPERFTLSSEVRRLVMERRKLQPIRGDRPIGNGEPPPGMQARPLEELRLYEPSDEELGG